MKDSDILNTANELFKSMSCDEINLLIRVLESKVALVGAQPKSGIIHVNGETKCIIL